MSQTCESQSLGWAFFNNPFPTTYWSKINDYRLPHKSNLKKKMMPDFWKSAELRNCHRINWERYLNQTFQLAPWPSRNLLHICKPLRSPDRKPRVSRFSSLSQKLLLVRLFIYLVYFFVHFFISVVFETFNYYCSLKVWKHLSDKLQIKSLSFGN